MDEGVARTGAPLITPERGVDSPVVGPHADSVLEPRVAYDGSMYMVAWWDLRDDSVSIRAARVSTSGFVLDPSGIPITGRGDYVQDEDVQIAAGGGVFVVVFRVRSSTLNLDHHDIFAVRIDPDAGLLDPIPLEIGAGRYPAIAYDGTQFVVFWDADERLHRARITPAGEVLDPGGVEVQTEPAQASHEALDVACAGAGRCAVAWRSDDDDPYRGDVQIRGAVLDAQGNVLGPGVQVLETFDVWSNGDMYMTAPEIAYDGSNYGVAWVVSGSDETSAVPAPEAPTMRSVQAAAPVQGLRVRRIGPRGELVDPDIIPIASQFTTMGDVIFDGTQFVTFGSGEDWCQKTMLMARWSPEGEVPVSYVAPLTLPGQRVAMAAGESRALMVWNDGGLSGDRHHDSIISGAWLPRGGATFDSAPFSVVTTANAQQRPAAAFDGENYLVAWTDGRQNSAGDFSGIHGARMTPTGQVLDPLGFEIAASPGNDATQPMAVFDGRNTVVLWGESPFTCNDPAWYLRAVRVSPAGEVLDSLPIPIPLDGRGVEVARSKDGILVTTGTYMVQMDQDGVVTGPVSIAELGLGGDVGIRAAAWDGESHLLVLHDQVAQEAGRPDLVAVRLSAEGTLLAQEPLPIGRDRWFVEADFDGCNYVVLWHHQGLRAARITPAGELLDPDGIQVTGSGAACAYDGIVDEVSLVHDGAATVIVWQTGDSPRGARDIMGAVLAPDGTVGPCFALADGPEHEKSPALASTGWGTSLLVYARFMAGEPFDAYRVRARLIDSGSGLIPCPGGFMVDGVCMPDTGTGDTDPAQDGDARGGCHVASTTDGAWVMLALVLMLVRRRERVFPPG